MSGWYNLDLTGTATENSRSNDIFFLSKTGVKIEFGTPVFLNSIVMKSTDGLQTVLEQGSDWDVKDDDYDWTSYARAQTVDSTFSQSLVKSITIVRVDNLLPIKVALSYQTLYTSSPSSGTINSSDSAEFTPPAWIDTLRRLGVLEQLAARVVNEQALTSSKPKLLEYDPTGTLADNKITDETYAVNTYSDIRNIRLSQGTFYRTGLSLTTEEGKILVEGTDYICVLFNRAKTQGAAAATAGAFDLIQLLLDYSGNISADYQAAGGSPTIADVSALYSNIQSVLDYLASQEILSGEALPQTPTVKNIINRISKVEDSVRNLVQGSPTFGDTTTGISVVKSVSTPDTTGLHWFTIARLYKVQTASGSSDLVTADRMRFRMHLVRAGIMADVIVAVDVDNPSRVMQLDATGVLQNVGFVPYESSNTNAVTYPQFRFIWNDNAGIITGGCLQIGINVPNGSETVSLEDLSGTESCFIMDLTNGSQASPIVPEDNNVALPDGQSTWSSAGTDSKVAITTMPTPSGYLVYEGTTKLNTFDTTAGSQWAIPHNLPSFFRIEDIQNLVVDIADPTNQIGQRVTIGMSSFVEGSKTGLQAVSFSGNVMNMKVTMTQDSSSGAITIMLSLDSALPQNVSSEVRYVTAQV